MTKLKGKKYKAILLIVVLVLGIISLFAFGKVDKYKGQIAVKDIKLNQKVLSSVGNASLTTSKGYDEVEYNITYTLDEVNGLTRRNVIIKGILDELDSNYAKFKEITGNNITSTLINGGKEIEVRINDVPLGQEQSVKLKLIIENAPNGKTITPNISIKESTGEFTNIQSEGIRVETNSIEGLVYDENTLPVSNIELSVYKDNVEVRRTYTDESGRFVFTDLETGNYSIHVEEEMYELVSESSVDANESIELSVKTVDRYNIETHKYIDRLRLVINGKEHNYTYQDAEEVVQNVKNAKTISGEIEYKVIIHNKGEKNTAVDRVIDEPSEGLSFNEEKNTGWMIEENLLRYKTVEGSVLKTGEKREIKLVLDIDSTRDIKTYINKLTTKGEIKEKVTYIINGTKYRDISVSEGDIIERPDFGIDNLDGWYTDSNFTNKYKFSNLVNKDLILYARTDTPVNEYTVRFIDKGNVIDSVNVIEGNTVNRPSTNPTKEGYTFGCWNLNNTCFDFDTGITSNIDLISNYNIINYSIDYNLNGGTVETDNPVSYNIETPDFTLNNPSKEGYTFTGWTGTDLNTKTMIVSINTGSTGNRTYTANYDINKYQLEIDPKGGTYSGDLLLEEDYGTIVSIGNPSKEGYEFTGWTLTGYGSYMNNTYTFGLGNGKLEANYTPITYTITYDGITDAERVALSNPNSYTIETIPFTLNNPSNRLDEDQGGEVFVGWKELNDTTPSISISLPDVNNLGNKKYTAIWNEREPNVYNITYDLKGGSLLISNPSTYKKSELPITLNNPIKDGYTFTGWTGSNGDIPGDVTIPVNTEGDLNYIANYSVNNYNISYDYTSCNLTPEEITALNNKGSYTILDSDFNLTNPNKYGYIFTGWTGTDLDNKTINVTVDTSKIKNLSYVANCDLDKYNVEFYNMNSNGEYVLVSTKENVEYNTSVSISDAPSVSLRGYTFKYWSLDKINSYDFSTPVTENIKLYAVYEKDVYTITYDLDDGSLELGKTNPDSYSVDTEEFTLNNPSKEGYTFTGWTGSNGSTPVKTITLPDSVLENKTYTANYEINKYTVTYMNGNDEYDHEEVNYNGKALGTSTNPTKEHNIFLYWTLNNAEYDFDTLVTENLTLYAAYEEVEAPVITHTPTEWTKNNVTVTIANAGTTGKDYTGYSYMYKIDDGDYQAYTESFEVSENCTIYAYSVKNTVSSVEVTHDITNIDKISPIISDLEEVSKTPVKINVGFTLKDNESGIKKYKVYVDDTLVFTSDEYTTNLNEEKEEEYEITGLEEQTEYEIKIEAEDQVGNISEDTISITTSSKIWVAQIIGENNTLFDDEANYIKFETLKEAIEYSDCVSNQCTIQMLLDVEESNSILDGQDITLDLNGKTITGTRTTTFTNNGILQIVDHNEDEVGKVVNTTSVAIENNSILTIGENEETISVSKTEPVIQGEVYGIENNSTFKFFDGKIIGDLAVKGEVTETPYSYNASIGDDLTLNKQVATLEIIADAEARINTTYYTKVQGGVDDSKNGTYQDVDYTRPLINQLRSDDNYRFIYDESSGLTINNNQNVANSVAHSYVKLDLTNYDEDELLTVNVGISSQSGYDIGYVTVTEDETMPTYDQAEGRFVYISGNTPSKDYTKVLEKGKVYYLHFGYRKDGGTNSGTDTFTLNSINLGNYVTTPLSDITNPSLVNDVNYYFVKQDDGSYVSNNTGVGNSLAHSFFMIDMTNIDEEKYLIVTANISSEGSRDYGYITVTDNDATPAYNQTEGRELLISGSVGNKTYPIKLIPNKKNFIHLGYYKDQWTNSGEDRFQIVSIKAAEEKLSNVSDGVMYPNGDYYFVEQEDGSYVSNNAAYSHTLATSYMKFDLTDVAEDKYLYVKAHYYGTNDAAYITVTDSADVPHYSQTEGREVYLNNLTHSTLFRVKLTAGRENYVHFGHNLQSYGSSDYYIKQRIFVIESIAFYDNTNTLPVYIIGNTTNTDTETITTPKLNEDVDIVQLLRNVTLTRPLEIEETRNVILDLNGYTLTSASEDYIIKNNGKLKIIDSNYTNQIVNNQEKYEQEEAAYEEEYQSQLAANQTNYELDQANYNTFINDLKSHYTEEFDYTGSEQVFTAPVTGTYKIETWGAQGGSVSNQAGGKGAYTSGNIELNAGDILYINVGGQPANSPRQLGGYNGGGNVSPDDDGTGRAGGGSTDIRLVSNSGDHDTSLNSRIMVAAGGGGSACESSSWCSSGGAGGTLEGLSSDNASSSAAPYIGTGGTQTAGGAYLNPNSSRPSGLSPVGEFGKGGDSGCNDDSGAGGSGYYGGGGSSYASAGGGGSSYISGYVGSVAITSESDRTPKSGCTDGTTDIECSYHYSGKIFTDTTMIAGNEEMPNYRGTETITGKEGNGYARIELVDGDASTISTDKIENQLSNYEYNYSYTGDYQEFIAPITAKYKLEAWGGSGGIDAYGAYTSGEIELQKGEKLYIYVGNKWTTGTNKTTFNGGTGNQGGYNGGSATDIRLVSGSWSNQESLASRIMVAGAGGSGDGSSKKPGAAGGLIGYSGGGSGGGSQNEVGTPESSSYTASSFGIANGGCTGGSGYYPGSGASCVQGAGGGSSYISGHIGAVAVTASNDITPKSGCETGNNDITCSYHYSGKVFTNTKMIDGQGYAWTNDNTKNKVGMPTIDGTGTMNGNSDAGAVRITIAKPELQEAYRKHAELDTNYVQSGNITSTTGSVILNNYGAVLDIDEAIVNLNKSGSLDVITNRGTLTIGENGYVNGLQPSNRGIYNTYSGDIIDGTGTITMSSTSNIGILNEGINEENIKGYNIITNATSSYGVYNSSINDLTLENITSKGTGIDIYQNTDNNLIVKNSNLKSTGNESFNSNQSSVESIITFNNCNIENRILNRNGSARKIIINESNMTGTRENVYNYSGTVEINNSTLENSSWNIENTNVITVKDSTLTSTTGNIYNGKTVTVEDSELNASGRSVQNGYYINNYGTYTYYPGTMTITDTDITTEGSSNTEIVYNYLGDLVIDGGSITNNNANSTAIYTETNSTVTIVGDFETSDNFNRGIYNNNGTVTLGDNTDTVSITHPLIRATNQAIYNGDNATYNYYDGKLIGIKDNTIDGIVSDLPNLYDLNVTKGETLETIILKSENEEDTSDDYVAQIGSTKYTTLQKAIDAVPDTNTETVIILLKNIETARQVTVPSTKNAKINQKNYLIKNYNNQVLFTNNGTLSFTDDTEDVTALNTTFKEFITNNGTVNYDKVKTYSIRTSNLVSNNENSVMNITSGEIYSYQTKIIDNAGEINMSGGKLYAERTNYSGASSYNLIENSGDIEVTGGELRFIGSGSIIYNTGTAKISNATVDCYGISYLGFTTVINNASETSYGEITGGTFGQTAPVGILMVNSGTGKIENITSNMYGFVKNSGTITITNVIAKNLRNDDSNEWYDSYGSSGTVAYNTGNMTIVGGDYQSSRTFMFNTGTLSITGSNILMYAPEYGRYTTYGKVLHCLGNSTTTVTNSNLTRSANIQGNDAIRMEGTARIDITDSTVRNTCPNAYTSWGNDNYPYVIRQTGNNIINITNTDMSSINYEVISTRSGSSGTITIIGGDLTNQNGSYGILNNGSVNLNLNPNSLTAPNGTAAVQSSTAVTINIGEKGGVPSKTNPELTGKTYGLNNTNENAVVNFYDGVISGDTAILGKINEIEPGYEIILETDTLEHKYLDKLPIIKNVTKYNLDNTNPYEYYSMQDAFDDASNGDVLEILRETTVMPTTILAVNDKTITIDLKGYKIFQNNTDLLQNDGTLTIKTSVDGGQIITNNERIFINNGTLNIESGIYNTTTSSLIISNNLGSVLNITGGEIYSTESQIIENDGEINMSSGKIYTTRTSNSGAGSSHLITNTGDVNITGGELTFIGRGSIIYNSGNVIVDDVTANCYGYYVNDGWSHYKYTKFIYNYTDTSYAEINGGTYGDTAAQGILIYNVGTAKIDGVTSNFYGYATNTGTITITNLVARNLYNPSADYDSTDVTAIPGYNSGTMTIIGGDYKGSRTIVLNDNTLSISGSAMEMYAPGYDRYTTIGNVIYCRGNSTTTIDDSTLIRSSDNNGNDVIRMEGNSSIDITDSTLNNTIPNAYTAYSNDNYPYVIRQTGNNIINITNTDMSSINYEVISTRSGSSGTITITGGDLTNQNGSYGIYNNGNVDLNLNPDSLTAPNGTAALYNNTAVTINIGEKGGVPSKTNPELTGSTYGLNNTNENAIINFYDGIISGDTAIVGKINEIEPGYEIILDSDTKEHKYLDRLPVLINTRTNEEYYDFKTAFTDALDNDTLEVTREYTTIPTTELGVNTKNITVDLKGFKIYQNNTNLIQNDGTLTFKSTVDGGQIISNSENLFINNGTLNIESGNYTITTTNIIIDNASTGTLNISGGNINANQSKLIDNAGTINVSGGTIRALRTDYRDAPTFNLIDSSGTINITDGTFYHVGQGSIINNTGTAKISGGTFECYGYYHSDTPFNYLKPTVIIENAVSSYAEITSGSFGSTNSFGLLMKNSGIGKVENVTSNLTFLTYNYGTLDLINTESKNLKNTYDNLIDPISHSGFISYNSGTLNITGGEYLSSRAFMYNYGNLNLDSTKIEVSIASNAKGHTEYLIASRGSGTFNIDNSELIRSGTDANDVIRLEGTSTLIINNSTLRNTASSAYTADHNDSYPYVIRQTGNNDITIIDSDLIANNYAVIVLTGSSSGTLSADGSTLTNQNGAHGIHSSGTSSIILDSSTITCASGNTINNNGAGSVVIKSGTYTTGQGHGIYNSGLGSITIGEQGGIPSITDPIITSTEYGIYKNNNNSIFNFYDGIIIGKSGSIYGTITETEPGYKEKRDNVTDPDTGVTTIESTLTVVGETERVAVVNNINFNTLQSAVNYAVRSNVGNITLYKNVTLEDDLVKPDGINVNIYLNNYTITQGSYTIDPGITLVTGQAPGGLGGAIYRFFANITGQEINPKNIVIYQMEDGSQLEANKTYKLYKLVDSNYKLVKFNEESVSRYETGNNTDTLRTNTSRIYINNIGEGTYKLVGSDNKELVFEISGNNVSSNIRINNSENVNRTSTSIATLILSLQTGVVRSPYILLIMIITIVTLSLIAYKKSKEEN